MVYVAIDVDMRMYLVSNQKKHLFMEAIKVDLIAESPDKAMLLTCKEAGVPDAKGDVTLPIVSNEPCEPWDEEYPMELAMQDDVINIIVSDLAKTMGIPEDKLNDSEDEKQ